MFMAATHRPAVESGGSQREMPYPWYARARQRPSGILISIIERGACLAVRVCVKVGAALPAILIMAKALDKRVISAAKDGFGAALVGPWGGLEVALFPGVYA
jgi:hypothetical protein